MIQKSGLTHIKRKFKVISTPLNAKNRSDGTNDARSRIALTGFTWTTIGAGLFAVLQIPVLAMLARLIPPAEFGVANAALIVFAFGANIFEGGVMLNIAQRKTVSDRDAAIAFQVSALLALAMFLLVFLGANLIEKFFETPGLSLAIQVIALGFLLQGFTGVSEALLFHRRKYRTAAIMQLLPYASGYVPLALALGFANYGYWAIVIGHLAMCAIRATLLICFARHPVCVKATWNEFTEHMSQTIEFSVGRLASFFSVQGDKIIVGRTLGMEALGLYGRAFQIMMIPSKTFTKVVINVTTPLYASIQDDFDRVATAFRKSIRLANLIMAPVTVAVIMFREELVLLLLGEDWVEIANVLGLLAMASYFIVLYRVPLAILHSQRMSRHVAISQSVYAVLIVLIAALVVRHGLHALATAISVLAGVNYLLLSVQALRRIGASGWTHLKAHGQGIWVGFGFLFASALLRYYWNDEYPDIVMLLLVAMGLGAVLAPSLYRAVKL